MGCSVWLLALLGLQTPALKHRLFFLTNTVLWTLSLGDWIAGGEEAHMQLTGKRAAELTVPPACACKPTRSEHGREKYCNKQSISRLPLSSGSSCADNESSKSPYKSETFFSPLSCPHSGALSDRAACWAALLTPLRGNALKYCSPLSIPAVSGGRPALPCSARKQLGAGRAVSSLIVPPEPCGRVTH